MRFLQEVTEDWTNAHSVFHGRLNFLNVMSFFKVMQHLSSSSFSAFCFLVEKSLVFFKNFPESVIGCAGDATGAVGVDAKLIVVFESVKLIFRGVGSFLLFKVPILIPASTSAFPQLSLPNTKLPCRNSKFRMLA